MNSGDQQDKLKSDFEKDEQLSRDLQASLEKAKEEGRQAPDFIEEAKKKAQKDKKSALPESDSSL